MTIPGDLNRPDLTTRGFTGHEHLNAVDLIHMNGRVYDYNLGRFLLVDPFIQFPENSQSVNGYSYILNNPLSGTDPTGYQAETDANKSNSNGTGDPVGGDQKEVSQRLAEQRQGNGTGQGFSLNWTVAYVKPASMTQSNSANIEPTAGEEKTALQDKVSPETRSTLSDSGSARDEENGVQDLSSLDVQAQEKFTNSLDKAKKTGANDT